MDSSSQVFDPQLRHDGFGVLRCQQAHVEAILALQGDLLFVLFDAGLAAEQKEIADLAQMGIDAHFLVKALEELYTRHRKFDLDFGGKLDPDPSSRFAGGPRSDEFLLRRGYFLRRASRDDRRCYSRSPLPR
jgi:hypothetical protein